MESKVRMFLQTGKMVNLRIVILPISDLAKLSKLITIKCIVDLA